MQLRGGSASDGGVKAAANDNTNIRRGGGLVARRRAMSRVVPSSSGDDSIIAGDVSGFSGEGDDAASTLEPNASTDEKELPAARSPVYLEHDPDGVAHGEEGNEFEAALLVTGTAVGGGSLALPYFCAAGGFFPAVGLLMVSYAALLAGSDYSHTDHAGVLCASTLCKCGGGGGGGGVCVCVA